MSRIFKTKDNQITCPYKKGWHDGIDLVGRQGDKFDYVVAHSDGVVVSVRKDYKSNDKSGNSYGNYVKIKHNNGYYTLSAHLAYGTVCVSNGQKVSKGQTIGYMGATGRADGAHVHFEVRNTSDVKIDPTPYIDADLPGQSKKIECEYRVWDNAQKEWLPKVKNTEDYAGNYGHTIGAFQLITYGGGSTKIMAHTKGSGWNDQIVDGGFNDKNNCYAGIKGMPIDAISIWSQHGDATYRVHYKNGGWSSWICGRYGKSKGEYAGTIGKEIDGIQCYIK